MKRYNYVTIILIVLAVLICATTLVACDHEHTVNSWKVIKEPTCTTEGLRRGACEDCGEVVEESVPTDPDNHVYGNWEVTVMPTADIRNGTGEVRKTCKENPDHYVAETLPSLLGGGKAYKSYDVSKEATVLEEGEVHAVYESKTYGDISVILTIGKRTFDPDMSVDEGVVGDAALLASSNLSLVRSGTGSFYNTLDGNGSITYVYGENYCHTNDGEDEKWYSLTSTGDIFGIRRTRQTGGTYEIKKDPDASMRNLNGYKYNYRSSGAIYYGAEGLLYESYNAAVTNANGDFREWRETRDDGVYYGFNYGLLSGNRFIKFKVEFSLDDDAMLKYVKVYAGTYFSTSGQFHTVYDEDSKKTTAILNDDAGAPLYEEYIQYNQTSKKDSPAEPDYEYTEDAFKITDIDLRKGNAKITDSTEPQVFDAGGGSNSLTLTIRGVSPDTASFDFDPVSLYLVNDNGRKIRLDASPDSSRKVYYTLGQVGTRYNLTIYSKASGTFTLMLGTESGYEKTFTIQADPITPTKLLPSVYQYSDAGYSWIASETSSTSVEIYVGQRLEMKASPISDEKDYADGTYTASLGKIASGAVAEEILSTEEGSSIVAFRSYVPGTYAVEMKSNKKASIKASVVIKVLAAPDMDTILAGNYSGYLKKGAVTVSFGSEGSDGKTPVTIESYQGTETLSVYYDESLRTLVCEHLSGGNLGVKLEINEAYKLVLAYPTGFGSGKERIILDIVVDDDSAE